MTRTPAGPARPIAALVTALLVALGAASSARAQTVVQIPLPGILDTRGVLTMTNGNLVPFTLTIDGGGGDVGTGGLQNGFATVSVAMMKSPGNVANSLPDDGHFPMNARHPDVVLNYNNADSTSPQNHLVKPMVGTTPPETFTFPVPMATYSKMFLFFHGADGGTTVKLTMNYADATTDVTMAKINDFGDGSVPPANGNVFVLVGNLAKWGKAATITEAGNHNIFGVEVDPMAKTLMSVKVERGNTGYLVFWGATGVATGAVSPLPDAGAPDAAGGAGTAGAAGTAGGAGTGGSAGAAGGASGTSGASGGAAGGGAAGASGGAGGQTSGAAGAGTAGAGAAGAAGGAGTAATGTAGASGTHHTSGGSSGCSLGAADGGPGSALLLTLGAGAAVGLSRRRRRSA
jgi:hypothetical protein